MSKAKIAAIASWSELESHPEKIAAFFSSDSNLEIYNRHFSILASNATSFRIQ